MNSLKANLKPLEYFFTTFCFVTVMFSLVLLLSFSPSAHAGHASVPETPDLQATYDSGHSGSDNITNAASMSFSTCSLILSEIQTLRLVRVPHGNAVGTGEVNIGATEGIPSGANANCPSVGSGRRTVTFFGRTLPEGDWDVYIKAIGQGEGFTNDSVVSGSIRVRVDRTAPTFVKATRVSDNAIDYYLTEGLRAFRPNNFNDTLDATFTFDPSLSGTNNLTATSSATERAANFFRINFSEAYATITSGVGKEISIDYAASSPSGQFKYTDEAGNALVDHSDSVVNYLPEIEDITLDQTGSHTITVKDPNAGDTLSAEWRYVDAAENCGVRDYGDSVTGTSVTLTGSDNTARTGPVTYDGSVAANVNRHVCVKVSDSIDVAYAISTNTVEENTAPTITIDIIEGDDYVNATERPTVEISGTSTNIANGGQVELSFSASDISIVNVPVTDNSWSYEIPSAQISIIGDVAVTVTASSSEATDVTRTFTIDTRDPVLAAPIVDQTAETGTSFTYQIPTNTFTDTNALTYTSSGHGSELTFTTDTWTGTPTTATTLTVTVTATDPAGNTRTDEFDIVISAPNTAPTVIALDNLLVEENTTAVGGLSTTDANLGDTHTYSLVAGTGDQDNGKFTIDNTADTIAFSTAPDFETPTDTGDTAGDNTYAVRIQTDDGNGGTFSDTFTITVTDAVEVVSFTIDEIADLSISEGVAYTSVTPNISGDTSIGDITYTKSGNDADDFTIDSTTGVVSMVARDYETAEDADTSNDYEITITATDEDGNTDEESWTVSVTDYLELGGVAINPLLWVKANVGITEASNAITGWTDQAPSSEVATASGSPVLSSSFINFNPSVLFDGTDDYFEFSKANLVKNRDTFTFIAVAGSTNAATPQHILASDQDTGIRIIFRDGNIELHRSNVGPVLEDQDPPLVSGDVGIVAISRSGTNGNDFATYQDGNEFTNTDSDGRYTYASGGTKTYLGRKADGGQRLNGQIAELVVFEDVLPEAELDKVQTNLAIKYGITLHSDVANYVNSGRTSVFANSGTYVNDIFGIAKDDASVLDQRISKSKNTGAILTVSTDNTFTGVNSGHADSLTDGQYLVIGNDGGATTIQSTETPGSTTNRITREWKVENTGSVGEVNLKFDGLDDTYTLYTDADGDFSAGATEGRALNSDGEIAATLTDGIYFALSTTTSPNTAPTDIALTLTNTTVDENQTVVGTFSTTDANVGDTHTYSLVSGTGDEDNAKFTITNNAIAFNSAPNHESPTDAGDTANNNTYAIRVKTVDQDSEEYIKEFIITVTDVDENDANLTDLVVTGATVTPAFAVDTTTYAATVDSTVTSVTVTPTRSHPDATITIGGNAATSGSATTVTLSNGANAIAVVVTAEDTSVTKTYTINITKTSTATILINEISGGYVNDAEDESAVTISGTSVNITAAQTIDLTFSDSNITATTAPVVVGTGGAADTWTTTIPSSEIKAAAEGTITVTAAYTGATTVTKTFIYDRTAPATPTLELADDTGSLDNDGITSDATVNVTGLETNATWEWTEDGTDGVVDGSGTSFELRANEGPYNYEVTQTDLAGNSTSSITYSYDHDDTAPNLDNAISDKTATVGTNFTYSIPSNTFTENGSPPLTYTSSGESFGIIFSSITWIGTPTAAATLSITLTATDVAGNTQTDEFDIVISASNSNPTAIALDNLSAAENTTAVGGLSTTDADVGDTHTYSLVAGTGDEDNGKFTIDNTADTIAFSTAPDFETPTDAGDTAGDNTYAVRIQTDDGNGGTHSQSFIITVTDVDESVPTPTTPTIEINAISTDGYVNGNEDDSDIIISGTSTDIANAETVTFEIDDSDTSDGTDIARIPVVGSDGTWSTTLTPSDIQGLAEGTVTVTVSYTGATDATKTFIYDTTAPTVSTARTGTDRRQTDTIVIGINENLAGTATTTDFTISYDNVTDANPTSVSLENGNINIRVSTEIERGDDSITVSYSGATITDTAGNALGAITNQTVENRVRSSGGGGGGGTVLLSGSGTGNIAPVVPNQYGPVSPVDGAQVYLPTTAPVAQRHSNLQFKRDLSVETSGDDVKELQEFLNNNGFPVSNSGAGSKGQETNYFGPATQKALAEYQETNDIPATGYLGEQTRQSIQKSIVINEIVKNIIEIQNRIKELQEREEASNIPTNAEQVNSPDNYYNTIINTIPIAPPQHRGLNAPMVDYFAQPQQSSEPQEESQKEEQSNAPTQNGVFYNMFSGQSKEQNTFRNYLSAPTL